MKSHSFKDRMIIAVCSALVAVLLIGAVSMTPSINHTRRTLQLTANDELMENLPPAIAFSQAALGAFRGLIVDILWARAHQMQLQGQVFEAMQLSDWITKFQPRFAEVWRFHAWNMAYNISVMTHTPQERWMWVRSGIDLLRDEAIPLNPNAIQLYKELSYIYMHKVGQYTDDMNDYYKKMVAKEWHDILGAPPQGTTEETIEHFRPIAVLFDRYLNDKTPDAAVTEAINQLQAARPNLADDLLDYPNLSLNQIEIELDNFRTQRLKVGDTEFAADSQPLYDAIAAQKKRMSRPPVERLIEDKPETRIVIERIRSLGMQPDLAFLKQVREAEDVRQSEHVQLLGLEEPEQLTRVFKPIRDFMDDPAIADARTTVINFIRAQIISQEYHMDPTWMLTLMEGRWFASQAQLELQGDTLYAMPIDWRHSMAHAFYWGTMGVRRSRGAVNYDSLDSLNTDRVAMSALQGLTFSGLVTFDPLSSYYRQTPDIRYIDAFNNAIFGVRDRVENDYDDYVAGTTGMQSYASWHEYFLTWAVQTYYFYGYKDKALDYYSRLRRLYNDFYPGREERYNKPLDEFVFNQFINQDNISSIEDIQSTLTALMWRAYNEGYATGQTDVAELCFDWAKKVHETYQKKFANSTKGPLAEGVDRGRLALPSLDEIAAQALSRYILFPENSTVSLAAKSRVWSRAKLIHKQLAWDYAAITLYRQTAAMGVDPRRIFPEPPGMEEFRKNNPTRSWNPQPDSGSAPIIK